MSSESNREFFEERGFGKKLAFGDSPVLLVIDMMNGFTDPDFDLGADLDAEVARIRELRSAARDADVPRIHVYSEVKREDLDSSPWLRKQDGADVLVEGSNAVAFDERLAPEGDEGTLRKRYASAFFGTDLVSRLTAFGADTVVVTGCTTSGCVRATAIDAVQYGYVPVVPAEAVGDRDDRAHEQSLLDLEMKYAEVVDVDEAGEYLGDPVDYER